MISGSTVGRTRWALEKFGLILRNSLIVSYPYPEGILFAQLAYGNLLCILVSQELAKFSHRSRPNVKLLFYLIFLNQVITQIHRADFKLYLADPAFTHKFGDQFQGISPFNFLWKLIAVSYAWCLRHFARATFYDGLYDRPQQSSLVLSSLTTSNSPTGNSKLKIKWEIRKFTKRTW